MSNDDTTQARDMAQALHTVANTMRRETYYLWAVQARNAAKELDNMADTIDHVRECNGRQCALIQRLERDAAKTGVMLRRAEADRNALKLENESLKRDAAKIRADLRRMTTYRNTWRTRVEKMRESVDSSVVQQRDALLRHLRRIEEQIGYARDACDEIADRS